MKILEGTVTAPKGFKATGNFVGIKKAKSDLMLLASDTPAVAAGFFTTNKVKAAPVLYCQEVIASQKGVKGIVTNSGNANACTGELGLAHAKEMAEHFASKIGAEGDEVLVCSTGVIGVVLPIETVLNGIDATVSKLGYTDQDGFLAAEAIMTTDTFMKTCAVEIEIGGKAVRIGGMAKGSGMIHPNMATMLTYLTTDANISRELLSKSLKESMDATYNMISVDRDTSTNDSLLMLANGMAENDLIDSESPDYEIFKEALNYVNTKLAKDIARDGEGATKIFQVTVHGAATLSDARLLARSVTTSNLLKAALYASDANFGRAICALGYSGVEFDPNKVTMNFRSKIGEINLMTDGVPQTFDEILARKILNKSEVFIDIFLKEGSEKATAWGCDLTTEYVKINGDYRT